MKIPKPKIAPQWTPHFSPDGSLFKIEAGDIKIILSPGDGKVVNKEDINGVAAYILFAPLIFEKAQSLLVARCGDNQHLIETCHKDLQAAINACCEFEGSETSATMPEAEGWSRAIPLPRRKLHYFVGDVALCHRGLTPCDALLRKLPHTRHGVFVAAVARTVCVCVCVCQTCDYFQREREDKLSRDTRYAVKPITENKRRV